MMIIRHAEERDLNSICELAKKGGTGLTSLPCNEDILRDRITRMRQTLDGTASRDQQGYLFVLEDTKTKKVVGLSALEVAVGLNEPWYNFHVGQQVHASKTLGVHKSFPTLFLSNDHTGYSELCTLFLDPDYRHSKNGKFLSKIRFLFISAFKDLFSDKLVAEMRGFSDENGESPFWSALGQQFFNTNFSHADYLSGTVSKAFITELMPRHPIYVDLLPQSAKDVIGKTHPHTQPAARLLESEGLRFQGYIDIFDAGPTLQTDIQDLRAVKDSQVLNTVLNDTPQEAQFYLVSNDDYLNYRGILAKTTIRDNEIELTQTQLDKLQLQQGQAVRILPLEA